MRIHIIFNKRYPTVVLDKGINHSEWSSDDLPIFNFLASLCLWISRIHYKFIEWLFVYNRICISTCWFVWDVARDIVWRCDQADSII